MQHPDSLGMNRPAPAAPLAGPGAGEQARLVDALARQLGARVLETHISWVLLAGDDAYKIKKALRTPFLDASTLPLRQRLCAEELRLNARLAPGVYLGVQGIGGPPGQPRLGGAEPLEYAVHMRRFPDEALAKNRLAAGRLAAAEVDAIADLLGRFHAAAPRAEGPEHGGAPQRRLQVAVSALEGAAAALTSHERQALSSWIHGTATTLSPFWAQRHAHGFVREGHGDLHLANLLVLPEGPAAFDCIEFDPRLRCIDTVDDIAFTVMDFEAHGRKDLAFRLLNRWLDVTGDHDGLAGLRFAVVYRALVRAQVALLHAKPQLERAQRYVRTALAWTQPAPLQLTAMHGLPGSGKTTVSQHLLQQQGAIRIRSDVERKRLFGLPPEGDSRAAGLDIYAADAGERTYAQVQARARAALQAGYPVILDAAHLRRHERDAARALAASCSARFVIAACAAPIAELRRRVANRRGDASEADVRVLQVLEGVAEPLEPDELPGVQHFAPGGERHRGAP
jgi:aminoglycoside phosphotransferase family enzyme/predicted kinase